jgi:FkbM family methyltransferase
MPFIVDSILAIGLIIVAALSIANTRRFRRLARRYHRLEKAETDLMRLRQKVYASEANSALTRAHEHPRTPIEFRSEFGEDMLLWDLFGGQTSGTCLEVGAFDGYHYSVSYAFDAVGWRCILIEPLPDRHEQCLRRRTAAHVEHAALGPAGSSGTITFTAVKGREMLSHIAHEGMGTEHLRNIQRDSTTYEVSVPLTTMDAVLERSGATGLDFASIDVEGGEMSVLAGFTLERWKPRALLIEDNSLGKRNEVADYLAARGYQEVARLAINRLYVRSDDAALIARAKELAEIIHFPSPPIRK